MGFNSGFKGLIEFLCKFIHTLLGAFLKLRKATITFVISVCLFVFAYGTTQLPLHEITWKFLFEKVSKNLSRKFKFHSNLTQVTDTCWILLRVRNLPDNSCTENNNTHSIFRNYIPKIVAFRGQYGKILWYRHSRAQMTMYGACALHAGEIRLQTDS